MMIGLVAVAILGVGAIAYGVAIHTGAQSKIEKNVVSTYNKIQDGVVSGYNKVQDGVVSGYKKVEDTFVHSDASKKGK